MRTGRSSTFFKSLLFMLLVAALLMPSVPASATRGEPEPVTVNVGVFTRTLAALAAQHKGFFSRHNLSVNYLQVGSSPQQFDSLKAGEYDLILTSPDNVANYRLNQNNALGGRLDVQMIMGSDYATNLSLVARPEYTSVEQLRGKTLAVDAIASGFSFVMFKILREHGLERGRDYNVIQAGGTPLRFRGLLAGDFDATLLNNSFDIRAVNAGMSRLATVYDVADPYLGAVAAARESWLRNNSETAIRFIQAFYEATQWSLDPANRDEAIALLEEKLGVDYDLAVQIYEVQLTEGVGLIPDVSVDRAGLLNVLKLRDEFGGFEEPANLQYLATPGSGLYDTYYYNMAKQRVLSGR